MHLRWSLLGAASSTPSTPIPRRASALEDLLHALRQGESAGRTAITRAHQAQSNDALGHAEDLHLATVRVQVGPDLVEGFLQRLGKIVGLVFLREVGLEQASGDGGPAPGNRRHLPEASMRYEPPPRGGNHRPNPATRRPAPGLRLGCRLEVLDDLAHAHESLRPAPSPRTGPRSLGADEPNESASLIARPPSAPDPTPRPRFASTLRETGTEGDVSGFDLYHHGVGRQRLEVPGDDQSVVEVDHSPAASPRRSWTSSSSGSVRDRHNA